MKENEREGRVYLFIVGKVGHSFFTLLSDLTKTYDMNNHSIEVLIKIDFWFKFDYFL